MNKLLNDYQFLELENEQLRKRIAELKGESKYPSVVFHLQEEEKEGGIRYTIVDECGYFQDSFSAESEEKAIEFFKYYKKNFKPAKSEILKSGITENTFHSLTKLSAYRISDLRLVPFSFYVVKINRDKLTSFDHVNMTEEEAINKYEEVIANYFNKQPNKENKKIII